MKQTERVREHIQRTMLQAGGRQRCFKYRPGDAGWQRLEQRAHRRSRGMMATIGASRLWVRKLRLVTGLMAPRDSPARRHHVRRGYRNGAVTV